MNSLDLLIVNTVIKRTFLFRTFNASFFALLGSQGTHDKVVFDFFLFVDVNEVFVGIGQSKLINIFHLIIHYHFIKLVRLNCPGLIFALFVIFYFLAARMLRRILNTCR